MFKKYLFLIFFLILSAVAQILMWSTGHNWGGDFSAYIMQAISLTDGTVQEFIEQNSFTIYESSITLGPVTYPWGFSLLLSPLFLSFGLDIIVFKSLILVFFLGFIVVLWFLFKDEFTQTELLIFVALFAFNPYFLRFGDQVLSDIPFLFFSTFSILVFSKLHKARSRNLLYFLSILLGLSFAAATSIRTNGVLLPMTYLIMLSIFSIRSFLPFNKTFDVLWMYINEKQTEHRIFIYSMPLVFFFIPIWILGNLIPDHPGSHLIHFEDVTIKSIFINFFYYSILVKDFFGGNPLNIIIYFLSLPLLLLGLREKLRNSTAILIYVFLTLALYILWPYRQGLRFIFPVLPFYLFFVFIGLGSVRLMLGKIKNIVVIVLLTVLVVLIFQSSFHIFRNISNNRYLSDGPFTSDAQEMFSFIRENVPKSEVVVFRKPRVLSLFTGNNSLYHGKINNFKYRHWYVIDKKSPTRVDLVKEDLFKLYPALLVFENSQFRVFKFDFKYP